MDRTTAAFVAGIGRLLALGIVTLLVAPFAWTVVTGDRFLEVTGVSMTPTYHRGDLLLVSPPTGDELTRTGQIVVATFGDGSGPFYVHRVHELTADGAVLKGDANADPDPRPITAAQVIGTPRLHLFGAPATLYLWSQTLLGRTVLVLLAALCAFGVPATMRSGLEGPPRHRRSSTAGAPSAAPATPTLVQEPR